MSLADALANDLRTAVDDGIYAPGDRLPNQTRIAVDHGVSQYTVHRAIGILVNEGLLEVKTHGAVGTYVRERSARVPRPKARPELEEVYIRLGRILRAEREAKGMTRDAVYDAIGMAKPYVAVIEDGRRRLPLHMLIAICEVLQMDPVEILIKALDAPQQPT